MDMRLSPGRVRQVTCNRITMLSSRAPCPCLPLDGLLCCRPKREENRMIGSIRRANIGCALVLFLLATAPHALAQGAAAPDYAAIVAAPERAEVDRAADARRKPAQLLAFTGVRPGMKVLDM